MKKIALLLFLILTLTMSLGFAENNAGDKLLRGVTNVITAPFEIPKQARAYWIEGAYKTDHILVWVFSGAVKGVVEGVKRASSGVWDIILFPISIPDQYESLYHPNNVFEDWPSDPDVFIFLKKDKNE